MSGASSDKHVRLAQRCNGEWRHGPSQGERPGQARALGHVSFEAAEALVRVIDAAYERRSLVLTSNIHPSGFDELMPKTLAAATVDGCSIHPHVVITDGVEGYRFAQAVKVTTACSRRADMTHRDYAAGSMPTSSITIRSTPPAPWSFARSTASAIGADRKELRVRSEGDELVVVHAGVRSM